MHNGSSYLILFMSFVLVLAVSGFGFLFFQKPVSMHKKAISCKNEWSTISFLLNEEDKSILMAGERLDPASVKIFNETAISADWKGKEGQTKVFLDRIAARLEVETSTDGKNWDKNEFDCTMTAIRF